MVSSGQPLINFKIIHGSKVLLCIWDMKSVYYELLKPNQLSVINNN